MMNNATCIVTTATDSLKVADEMAHMAIKKKLAACVQIIPGVKSTYFWDGQITTSTEHLLHFKTLRVLSKRLQQLIGEKHAYEIPEITVINIDDISINYGSWLKSVLDE